MESYNESLLLAAGIFHPFVQDNHSFSLKRGTIRGFHFQKPPKAQAKLVRVTRGAIFDVALDLRQDSPTFKQWCGVVLSAELHNQLYIPAGFAHAFCTLEECCEVQYKVNSPYDPSLEGGICYNDSDLAIPWPLDGVTPLLSRRDLTHPTLREQFLT